MKDRYHQAAVAYFLYGIVYLSGAWFRLTPERQVSIYNIPWWAFYIAGALLVIVLPLLVWKHFKWFTRIIVLGPTIKAVVLLKRELPATLSGTEIDLFNWFFVGVALVAAYLLFRAGWGEQTIR